MEEAVAGKKIKLIMKRIITILSILSLSLRALSQDTCDAPISAKMHMLLVKYSVKYDVPFKIAYGVARKESGYMGPTHLDYNPAVKGGSAYGPMQIQLRTARVAWKQREVLVTSRKLMTDIEFNIETAMKILSDLKKEYGSWTKALGAYNTGKPISNSYARQIMKGLKYEKIN